MQRITFALGVAAALLVSGFAQAEGVAKAGETAQADEIRRLEVSYGDLDLARVDQADKLYWRIQHAAHHVCEVNTTPASRALLIERKCVRGAVDSAIQSVGNPNLTAIYLARSGRQAMVASSR
jgi:UrcA family protein